MNISVIVVNGFFRIALFAAERVIRTSEIEPTLRAKLAFTSGKEFLIYL